MRIRIWSGIAVATVALTLLSLVGQSQAGPVSTGACCVCDRCDGRFSCSVATSEDACRASCAAPGNETLCGFELVNRPCGAIAECPVGPLGAPALGEGGLTAVALFLAALGVLGVRRAARRKRA